MLGRLHQTIHTSYAIKSQSQRLISRRFLNKRSNMKAMSSFITLEEHYLSHNIIGKANAADLYAGFPKHLIGKLQSLSDERISDMDKGDVSVQVLSHAPLTTTPTICTEANDELALAISKNPNRLAGFAMLPIAEPKAAAKELARCIQKLGFVGALIDNHLDGRFYDDEYFWPVFEKVQDLDVPIYLHPTFASDPMLEHYKGNYPENVARALSAHGWGWHTETGLHVLRLFAAGLFDRFPKLKIVIGHMGEMLPFQIERCISQAPGWGGWKRGLREVWRENVWVTTSGMFTLAPLRCLLETTAKEHVLYSVDYPFSATEKGKGFVDEIRTAGVFTEEEMEGFVSGNARKLLKIKEP